MEYSFTAFGHKNILATHRTTLEFTKYRDISLKGDCIVAVNSDFDNKKLRQFISNIKNKNNKNVTIIIIKNKEYIEKFNAVLNPLFDDEKEIVIRKSDFASKRTFALLAEKGAIDLSREFVDSLKNPKQNIETVFIAE